MPVSDVGPQHPLQPVYKYTQGKYTSKPVSDSQCVVPLNSIALYFLAYGGKMTGQNKSREEYVFAFH